MFKQLLASIFSSADSLAMTDLPQALTEADTVLLDVREENEFISGHISQAINHPLSRLEDFEGDKGKTYLIVCQSGMRSQRATTYLTNKGYRAINVAGGMNAWTGPIKGGY